MQLILDTESTLDIRRDMSSVEEPLNEKIVANGDVEDLNDTKCNGNKENLVGRNIIVADEECPKVNNLKNLLTKTLANVEDELLDNNYECLEKSECGNPDENREQNADSDTPIRELIDSSPNNDVDIDNSNTSHVPEEINEELIEDDIISIKDKNNIVPEILDTTKIDKKNDTKKQFIIEDENLLGKEGNIKCVSEKIASVSNDDIENIDNKLELGLKDGDCNNLNITQSCDALTKDTEESIKENKIDIEGLNNINVETPNELCEIPDLSDDAEESEPIEHSDVMDVEEVLVKPNNSSCDVADLNKDQVTSKPIELQDQKNGTVLPDVVKDETSDKPNITNLNEEVISTNIELQDKVDVEELKDIVEEVKSDISDSVQNARTNKDTQPSAPSELRDEIKADDVECVSKEIESSECCRFKFPKLDESGVESTIEVQDEMDVEEIKEIQENKFVTKAVTTSPTRAASPAEFVLEKPVLCKLSNTLDILSDDDEEPPSKESQVKEVEPKTKTKEITCTQQQSINIEDDDDIMLIDEDLPTETNKNVEIENNDKVQAPMKSDSNTDMETGEDCNKQSDNLFSNSNEKESTLPAVPTVDPSMDIEIKEKTIVKDPDYLEPQKSLLPENFLLSAKKNLADMTREDLEEFCILKIVESIVDRSSLSDIKAKLKSMAQSVEENKKKAMMLTKQNRDLQVVLKSVQEEQKKMTDLPITPLKITRSVGMQVLMTDKLTARRKAMLGQVPNVATNNTNRQNVRPIGPSPRVQKPTAINQTIPVPRLVPANTPAIKSPSTVPTIVQANTPGKTAPSPVSNGIKALTPAQKAAEKRQHNRIQSVTVDLTDDEPPAKMNPRNSSAPPVRLVPPQNLMAPQRQPFAAAPINSPRKVYIPISGPQNQPTRPGQTIMLKPVAGTRPRCAVPQPPRIQNPLRRVTSGRHPAPLPDAMKQYQPPNWKALPPAPDLRLSKVENGIVISWKIEGYQEDSYEEIASYQLYAYQETSSPPSTSLWKKIGDVKALPLPMACTLTQFMAGFKYYFAVRAVDVKSRLGPFSLPGSILLLNKL